MDILEDLRTTTFSNNEAFFKKAACEIEQLRAENAALKEQLAQQAAMIEQMREAFRVASMDTETINRKAPEIAKGCCSMPMPDTEGTYHLANEEVCNVVSSYLYWLHKNQPTALQPSPEILQARDKRVAEAITKYLRAVGVLSYEGTALQGIISGEWRKYL